MTTRENKLMGTEEHQLVLEAIKNFYKEDDRVRQIILFGSLSRGNWDQYSDLDLDIIVADNITIDARVELDALCAGIQNQLGVDALIIADVEEGDVVLSNLAEFSIRYHVLSDTKPAILDTMYSVAGLLSYDEIRASADDAHYNEPQKLGHMLSNIIG